MTTISPTPASEAVRSPNGTTVIYGESLKQDTRVVEVMGVLACKGVDVLGRPFEHFRDPETKKFVARPSELVTNPFASVEPGRVPSRDTDFGRFVANTGFGGATLSTYDQPVQSVAPRTTGLVDTMFGQQQLTNGDASPRVSLLTKAAGIGLDGWQAAARQRRRPPARS